MRRKALVLGLGKSGCSAARLLQADGYETTAMDQHAGSAAEDVLCDLAQSGVVVLQRQEQMPDDTFDLVVVSPGIPVRHPLVVQAQQRCGEVISELELGYRYCRCPVLAVTGTNGKSTLTRLLDDILRQSGLRSAAGGNLGTPLCELALDSDGLDWVVVEVSSFQLELVQALHPRGAVFLNLQPDHLDRHGDMETYFSLKCRLFARMQAGDCGVVQESLLPGVRQQWGGAVDQPGPDWVAFGGGPATWRYDPEAHAVVGPSGGAPIAIPVRDTYFDNPVTGATAAAAVALSMHCCGVSVPHLAAALAAFRPLPHRLERVAEIEGIVYMNDSKATNMAAMCAALSMQTRPVRLLAGGQLKEKDVIWTKQVLKKHVACAYLIGESAPLLAAAWCDTIQVQICGTLEKAMEAVWVTVQLGDVVLLSPGCASFDQFQSYAERGRLFACMVMAGNKKE